MENISESKFFENILSKAASLPGVRINREEFLRSQLDKYCSTVQVNEAINSNPSHAGINPKIINRIAKGCINKETNLTTAISTAAGLPGGIAMAATIPGDMAQYFAYILRIMQKLAYLYGWPDLFDINSNMDDQTSNLVTLFLGVMFGVKGAASAIAKLAGIASERAGKNLIAKALTKTTIYQIVKKISKAIGVKMTKSLFAKGVSKAIPVIGAVTSGALTYATFKPMAYRLKKHLESLPMSNVNYCNEQSTPEFVVINEDDYSEII